MSFADYYWIIWLGALVAFEVGTAIFKVEWTLSRHIWKWFAVGKKWSQDYAGIRWFILLGMTLSMGLHFLIQTSWIPILVFSIGSLWSMIYHYRNEK